MRSRWHPLMQWVRGVAAGWTGRGILPSVGESRSYFDELAKGLARGMSRREALRLAGAGVLGAVLLPLGRSAAWAQNSGSCGGWYECTLDLLTEETRELLRCDEIPHPTARRNCRAAVENEFCGFRKE